MAATAQATVTTPLEPILPQQFADNHNMTFGNVSVKFYRLKEKGLIMGSFSKNTPLSIEQQKGLIDDIYKEPTKIRTLNNNSQQQQLQIEELEQLHLQQQQQLEQLQQQLQQQQANNNNSQQQITNYKQQLQQQQQQNTQLQQQLQQQQANNTNNSQQQQQLQQRIKELEVIIETDRKDKQQQLQQQLQQQKQDGQQQLQQQRDQQQLQQQLEQLQQQTQQQQQKLQQLQQQLTEATTNNSHKEVLKLRSELAQIGTDRDGKEQQIEALRDEVDLWREQVENYRQQLGESRRIVFERDIEIQKKISELNKKELETIKRVEAKETEMLGLIQSEIHAAKTEWDTANKATIDLHLTTINNQQATIAQYQKEVIEVIKDKKIDKWETWETWGITIISGLAYVLFMIYQGINSYDYFLMENTEGVQKTWYSAGAFAFGFSTLGFILTMVLPMANKKLAEAYLWEVIPVRILPLTAFTIACIYMNFYYNTKGNLTDSFFSNIGFQSALPPLCEYAFGFVILVLVNKRKEIIELLKLITAN
jgi:hypothetical protein